jgi:hypothetical protein
VSSPMLYNEVPRPAEVELKEFSGRQSKMIEKRWQRVYLRFESQPVKRRLLSMIITVLKSLISLQYSSIGNLMECWTYAPFALRTPLHLPGLVTTLLIMIDRDAGNDVHAASCLHFGRLG